MPCVEISEKLFETLRREAEKRGETVEQTLKRILELYFGGEEEEKEILRRLRDLGYA